MAADVGVEEEKGRDWRLDFRRSRSCLLVASLGGWRCWKLCGLQERLGFSTQWFEKTLQSGQRIVGYLAPSKLLLMGVEGYFMQCAGVPQGS